jgi:nucleoside-diphosphate-sugar epimerase
MRVLETGGTDFVGSHSVAALVRSGHEVRLLVRSPQRIAPALEPVDVHEVDSAEGDVTDRVSVERAMEGCQAVLHSASVYSFRRRDAKLMEETNARGTDLVLGTAQRLGLDPIVYVSSYVALLPANDRVLTAESPLGTPSPAYARSKADAERVALLHAQLIEQGRGPRRYMAGGAYVPFSELVDSLARATGRAIRHRTLPDLLARLMARFNEAIYTVHQAARCDDSRTRDEFGIIPRDPERPSQTACAGLPNRDTSTRAKRASWRPESLQADQSTPPLSRERDPSRWKNGSKRRGDGGGWMRSPLLLIRSTAR